MDKFPACFDQNIGMNLGKYTYLFQRSKREPSAILVGLIPDSRLYRQDFLPYYIIYPYPIFFYTLHTRTYFFYIQLFPVKGVKGTSFKMVEAQRAAPPAGVISNNYQITLNDIA